MWQKGKNMVPNKEYLGYFSKLLVSLCIVHRCMNVCVKFEVSNKQAIHGLLSSMTKRQQIRLKNSSYR